MNCREIMTANPVCCLPEDEVGQVARLMRREHIASLPVISDERSRTLIGIVTSRDLVTRVLAESRGPSQTQIGDIMTRTIVACRGEDDMDSAIAAMHEHEVGHLPVIDRDGRILGIISPGDIRVTYPHRADGDAAGNVPGGVNDRNALASSLADWSASVSLAS